MYIYIYSNQQFNNKSILNINIPDIKLYKKMKKITTSLMHKLSHGISQPTNMKRFYK